jgi:hypothetical protein
MDETGEAPLPTGPVSNLKGFTLEVPPPALPEFNHDSAFRAGPLSQSNVVFSGARTATDRTQFLGIRGLFALLWYEYFSQVFLHWSAPSAAASTSGGRRGGDRLSTSAVSSASIRTDVLGARPGFS